MKIIGMAAVAACAALTAEGANAFSYIQKGLAACYDGVENAGAGMHDPNATTWADLTGHGHDGTMGSGVVWTDRGWQTGTSTRPVVIGPSLAAVTGSETFTLEFAGLRSSTARGVLFGQYAADYGVNMEYSANGTGATANSLRLHFLWGLVVNDKRTTLNQYTTYGSLAYANGDSATVALTTAPAERGLWKNGVFGTFSDTSQSALEIVNRSTTCPSAIGGDFRTGGQVPFIGTCHAFRVYDRVLTPDELAINAAVDAVRFRGADPATLTLPNGWAFDAQANLVKTVSASALGGTVCLAGGADAASFTTNVVQSAESPTLALTFAPDAGYEFVAWGGDTNAFLSVDGLEVVVDCSEPATVYAVFRPSAPPTASTADADYVTDGLVAWYDGADNAGAGVHSGTAATWTDLSGNNRDAIL
ncbi:MAG: hypothetical protein IJ658_04270, partial [Kiritimatiellae bacterium]|nr:hypothetical protein [Kiritimatiellia bacterium]